MTDNGEILKEESGPSPADEMQNDLRRAAQGMSAITDLASRLLVAYVDAGGTWGNLGRTQINRAYDISIDFMQVGEERWAQRMQQILAAGTNTGGGGGVDEKLPIISEDPTVN